MKTEEHHKEGLLSAPKDQHPGHIGRSKVVLYIGPANWILAGSTVS
jgi:hypothetical protein